MKKVCIIILNYMSYQLTIDFIKQLNKLDNTLFDILVIDNASPNASARVLNELKEKLGFVFIENRSNDGYAKGNNIGLRYAFEHSYEYSWVVNNDLIINDPDIIKKLLFHFDTDSNLCCVGPKIVDLNSTPCAPYPYRPSFWNLTFGIRRYHKSRLDMTNVSNYVYRLHGCCILMDTKKIAKIGYFDERTFLYCEEEILAEKLLLNGLKSYYDSNVRITHLESSTVGTKKGHESSFKRKCVRKSMNVYLKKYRKFNFLKTQLCIFVRNLRIYFWG